MTPDWPSREAADGGAGDTGGGFFYTDVDLAVDKYYQQVVQQRKASAEMMLEKVLDRQEEVSEAHRLKLMQSEEALFDMKHALRIGQSRPPSPGSSDVASVKR